MTDDKIDNNNVVFNTIDALLESNSMDDIWKVLEYKRKVQIVELQRRIRSLEELTADLQTNFASLKNKHELVLSSFRRILASLCASCSRKLTNGLFGVNGITEEEKELLIELNILEELSDSSLSNLNVGRSPSSLIQKLTVSQSSESMNLPPSPVFGKSPLQILLKPPVACLSLVPDSPDLFSPSPHCLLKRKASNEGVRPHASLEVLDNDVKGAARPKFPSAIAQRSLMASFYSPSLLNQEPENHDKTGIAKPSEDGVEDVTLIDDNPVRMDDSTASAKTIERRSFVEGVGLRKKSGAVRLKQMTLSQHLLPQKFEQSQTTSRRRSTENTEEAAMRTSENVGTSSHLKQVLPLSPFDQVPKKAPLFAYKFKDETAVRKRNERKHLKGFCREDCCKDFCDDLEADTGKTDLRQKFSRHRARFTPPSTPDGYWDTGFPPTPKHLRDRRGR